METATEVIVSCPSCARPMEFRNSYWQCLACHPIPANIPVCKTQICKRPLTKLGEPWNCWICLTCNRHPDVVNKMKKEEDQRKKKYLDKKLTTGDVSEMIKAEMAGVKDMIRDALAEQRPARAEIQTMTATEAINAQSELPIEQRRISIEVESLPEDVIKPETYLQKAKRLGVATHIPTGGLRKKAEVLADIATKEMDEIARQQSPPGENDEYARGLTADDMM